MQAEYRIAERDHERLLASEVLTAQDRVAQPSLHALARVEVVDVGLIELKRLEQILLVRRGERPLQFRIEIEMILDGALVAAGNEENLFYAVCREFLSDVLHDGLARHRQHFFRLRFRCR